MATRSSVLKLSTITALAALMAIMLFALVGCSGNADQKGDAASAEIKLVHDGKLTAASDFGFPPFEYMEGDKKTGFSVELVDALCEKMGLEANWTDPMKFDTIVPQVNQHTQIDVGVASITITDERLQEIDFTEPYLDSNQSLCVMAGSSATSASDLDTSEVKIGVQSGTSGEAWAQENMSNASVVAFDEPIAAFTALQAGQVNAVCMDLPVTQWLIKNSFKDATIIEEIPTGEQYGIAVSKDNPALTEALNKALEEIKADGTYQKIYDEYFTAN